MRVKNNVEKENRLFEDEDLSRYNSVKKKTSDFFGAWKDFEVELLKKRSVKLRENSKKRKLVRF